MAFGNETLHVKHLLDGKRQFNIIDEQPDCLLLQDQDTGMYWNLNVPLSLAHIIRDLKKTGPVVGCVLISEHERNQLKWTLRRTQTR